MAKAGSLYYGWIIVIVAGLAHFCSAPEQIYVISIFLEPMTGEMGWSRTNFSGMYTIGSLSAALFMIGVGRLLDNLGARKTLSLLTGLMLLSTVWMSNVDNYWKLLLAFMCLRTIGQGSFVLVATTTVSMCFIRLRGRATSIAYLGGAISIALVPFLVHLGIANFGWRETWLMLGISVFVLLLPAAILFLRDSPETAGLEPDGKIRKAMDGSEDHIVVEPQFTLASALKTRSLWMLTLASLAQPLIMTGLMFHHVSILGSKGLPPGIAAGTMGLFGPLMLIGNIACGYLNDKFSNRYVLVASQVILGISMVVSLLISESWHAICYVALAALSIGLSMNTNTVIWANYFGRQNLGSIRGFSSTIMVAFSALGALPFGYMYDRTGSYDSAIAFMVILPILATAFSIFALPPIRPTINS